MKVKKILLLVMAICLASGVRAQFDSKEVFYYVPTETVITENTEIFVIYFSGSRAVMNSNQCAIIIGEATNYWRSQLLKQLENPNNGFIYDASLSTATDIVYKSEMIDSYFTGNGFEWVSKHAGYSYLSISQDKSYIKRWRKRSGKNYKENEKTYKLVKRDDIVPRPVQQSGQSNGGSSFSGGYGGNYNGGSYGGYNGSSSSSSSSSSIPRTKCPNCNNGRKVYESTVPYSGTQTRYSTCLECGKRYMSSHTTHRHDRCTTCHGRGYLD